MAPVFLFPSFEFYGLGNLLPFTVLGHFEGRTAFLPEDVNGVVLLGEGSGKILRTIVVDEIQRGGLLVLDTG